MTKTDKALQNKLSAFIRERDDIKRAIDDITGTPTSIDNEIKMELIKIEIHLAFCSLHQETKLNPEQIKLASLIEEEKNMEIKIEMMINTIALVRRLPTKKI